MSEIRHFSLDVTMPDEQAELYRRGREVVLNAPQLFVDIDVEADGVTGYGSMRALAGQSPTGETFYREIKPITDLCIPSQHEFCEQNGLERARLLAEAPDAETVITEFHAWAKGLAETYDKKPVLTAWGPDFDASFVKLYYALAGIYDDYPFSQLPLDLRSLALPLSGTWNWELSRKKNLPKGITPDETEFTHFAPDDVKYQQLSHFGMAAILGTLRYEEIIGAAVTS